MVWVVPMARAMFDRGQDLEPPGPDRRHPAGSQRPGDGRVPAVANVKAAAHEVEQQLAPPRPQLMGQNCSLWATGECKATLRKTLPGQGQGFCLELSPLFGHVPVSISLGSCSWRGCREELQLFSAVWANGLARAAVLKFLHEGSAQHPRWQSDHSNAQYGDQGSDSFPDHRHWIHVSVSNGGQSYNGPPHGGWNVREGVRLSLSLGKVDE